MPNILCTPQRATSWMVLFSGRGSYLGIRKETMKRSKEINKKIKFKKIWWEDLISSQDFEASLQQRRSCLMHTSLLNLTVISGKFHLWTGTLGNFLVPFSIWQQGTSQNIGSFIVLTWLCISLLEIYNFLYIHRAF